jgi:multicomponent Na+:H+ antiporter subunit E
VSARVTATTLLLAGVYLMMLGRPEPLDLAVGVVLGAGLATALDRFTFAGPPAPRGALLSRLVGLVPLTLVTLREIVTGTWRVSLVVLHLRPLVAPGIVAIPIGERTPRGVALSGLLLTLAPGEFLVEVDREHQVMLVHVLDAGDPDAVRERHLRFYERYQRRVLP